MCKCITTPSSPHPPPPSPTHPTVPLSAQSLRWHHSPFLLPDACTKYRQIWKLHIFVIQNTISMYFKFTDAENFQHPLHGITFKINCLCVLQIIITLLNFHTCSDFILESVLLSGCVWSPTNDSRAGCWIFINWKRWELSETEWTHFYWSDSWCVKYCYAASFLFHLKFYRGFYFCSWKTRKWLESVKKK